ncbi:DUF544 domain-containing protein [Chloropicon primus]|uniref:DUF544 domain-containing protein n=2 Tax=Chloropicon primus TaxID=1764295 RepID=A0A5B8N0B3_9CHLO|nr:DUF544 domain-containing protein [Chloropicon primus]UPR04541.1 DUF544 domain-containing protein [Chloropicon primus]|eukprot:QDZ25335.1 DUF544 domain-containing protein [Chloropicon primus]
MEGSRVDDVGGRQRGGSGGGGGGGEGTSGQGSAEQEQEQVFELKTIPFFGREVTIILQNANGPCPLLAIANALLLRNTVQLPERCKEARTVHIQQLMSIVAEHMLDANKETKQGGLNAAGPGADFPSSPRTVSEMHLRTETIRQNISDAISILPKLLTGVDVNPRFFGCRAFEFTDEVAIFDLLDISLFHGWLYAPESEHAKFVGEMSYNQLVEKVVRWDVGEQKRRKVQEKLNEVLTLKASEDQKYAAPLGPAAGDDKVQVSLTLGLGEGAKGGEGGLGDLIDLSLDDQGEATTTAAGEDASLVRCNLEVGKSDARGEGIQEEVGKKTAKQLEMECREELRAMEDEGGRSQYECYAIQDFLETTSSQLTTEGLFALQTELKERELAVFFRNNHFSTVFKFKNKIHLLVTDTGYRDVPEVVWECMTDTHGNNQFVSGFTDEDKAAATPGNDPAMLHQLQEETDFALALQMQQAEQQEQEQLAAQLEAQQAEQRRLEEEHRRRQEAQRLEEQRHMQLQAQRNAAKESKKCTIM